MSYEGYTQNICESGHRFDCGDLLHLRKEPLCPHCKRRICWSNAVDQTNGEDVGLILEEDWVKFLHTPEEIQVCNLGHSHITKPATYLVPTPEEEQLLRTVIVDWKEPDSEGEALPVRVYLRELT